jgi:mono/diheme cytochrome c family protein
MFKCLSPFLLCMFFLSASNGFSQEKKTPASKNGTTSTKQSIVNGKAIYARSCVSCHQTDGGGMPNMNPPLTKTSYVLGEKEKLIMVLLKGMSHEEVDGESYHNVMPAFDYLSDQEIADVLTFVRNNFGNKAKPISVEDVQKTRTKLKP